MGAGASRRRRCSSSTVNGLSTDNSPGSVAASWATISDPHVRRIRPISSRNGSNGGAASDRIRPNHHSREAGARAAGPRTPTEPCPLRSEHAAPAPRGHPIDNTPRPASTARRRAFFKPRLGRHPSGSFSRKKPRERDGTRKRAVPVTLASLEPRRTGWALPESYVAVRPWSPSPRRVLSRHPGEPQRRSPRPQRSQARR